MYVKGREHSRIKYTIRTPVTSISTSVSAKNQDTNINDRKYQRNSHFSFRLWNFLNLITSDF